MILFPAIDLLGGRVVRLREGDFARVTDYPDDPAALAERYCLAGARYLHVVDLDGAREGTQANFDAIRRVRQTAGLFIQAGGGARDEDSVKRYLDLGVDRVIIGSAAVTNPAFLEGVAGRYPRRIAAGVDARDGYAAIHGWKETTSVRAMDLLARLPGMGVAAAVYTDIARDGMMAGANLQAYRETRGISGLDIIASGGVSALEDIRALAGMGLCGAVVGKALLGGTLSLTDALAAAEGKI
jgi:phosphoribosylformimino-5-aminoimidazole carboxamide ribotide isomerase